MSGSRAIALIAHDRCKPDMVAFARSHADVLRRETLIATRTTGTLLEREVGLDVECVLSGPEGGLSLVEEQAALAAGFVPVNLGPRVLRAETAPLAVLAALTLA